MVKILVVEDEYVEALDIKKSLESFGYQVPCIVAHGEEASEKAHQIKPDLILMDIVLKGNVDGIDAAFKIKELDIPVVYLTAHSEEPTVKRAKLTEPFGYLLKPFQAKELSLTIEMALYKAKMEKNIKKNQEKFRLLYENAPLPYHSINSDGIILDVNETWLTKMGFKRGEVLGRFFIEFLTPASQKKFKTNFPQFKKTGQISNFELKLVKKDGTIITTLFEGKVSYDLDGKFKHTNCIFQDITQSRKAYHELEKSKEKLKGVLNASSDSIFLIDTSGILIQVNDAVARRFNVTLSDMIGSHIKDFIPEEVFKNRWKYFKKAIDTGEEVFFEDKRDETYFAHYAYPIEVDGQVNFLAVYSRDITQQKLAEDKIRESEARYRLISETIPVAVYSSQTDEKSTNILISGKIRQLTGYNRDEFIENPDLWSSIIHPDDVEDVWNEIKKQRRDKSILDIEYRIKTRNGKIKWIRDRATPVMNEKGTIIQINGFMEDISQRKKMEDDLKSQFLFFQNLIDIIPYPIFYKDSDYIYQGCNQAFENFIGKSRDEIIGKTDYQIYPPKLAANYQEKDWKLFQNPGTQVYEAPVTYADGTQHIVIFNKATYSEENNNTAGLIGIMVDITDRKEFEDKLKDSLKEKESLIREIHHRVKNNMQIISSLLSLQLDYVDDSKSYELFQESRNRVKSMAMIHEKLYMADELSKIDFQDFIENLLFELFANYGVSSHISKNIYVKEVELDISTAVPCALIINELVTNSIKHAFSHERSGEVRVRFHKSDDNLVLKVSDNGVGLPEDIDFKNTKTLGLQLVNTLVKQLEGKIELDRSQGTCFIITFKSP
jgi:PAS domain S-box-containing protein